MSRLDSEPGRSRGSFSIKSHVVVDALGNPLQSTVASRATGDNLQATPPLAGQRAQVVVADRNYDAGATIRYVEQKLHATATIPATSRRVQPRPGGYAAYKEHYLVECFAGKLEHVRRAFSRFDEHACRYLAFVHCASTPIRPK